ncbi:hypothetical protein [Amycolatopsis anabasis]|uniref:hypothetical protein n=1 Tax=Amycolatopsis anabasis TaxID=1840409 RepID=UPI00131D5FAA|nr:hypothetical protein [Amycolatopsis anabasis]
MSFALPSLEQYTQTRDFGNMVWATADVATLPELARRIVAAMGAEYGPDFESPRMGKRRSRLGRKFWIGRPNWGVNAWVYGGRFVDFEIHGFLDSELADPGFLTEMRGEYAEFVERFNWTRDGDHTDRRFHGSEIFICNENEQAIRWRTGRVFVYRPWRRVLGRRFQPFLPMDTGLL